MAETVKGVIQGWRRKMKRGAIQLENGKRLPFTFDVVINAEKPQHVRNNMRVSAVIENGVIQSVTIEGIEQPIPQPLNKPHPGSFLNPYNFVRFLEQPAILPSEQDRNRVLWRCAPPPHDRYVGLTGRITCRVEAVTPLFISDSHAIQEEIIRDENGRERTHYTYRFFQLDGKPAIPASSLRGMIRSVFEAVTNSCFAIIHDDQLDYRIDARKAPSLRPAVVVKLPNPEKKEDGEVLLLESAWVHRLVIEQAIGPGGVLSEHVTNAPWPREAPFNAYFDKVLRDQTIPVQARVRVNVRKRSEEFGGKKYRFPFNEVVEIVAVGAREQGLQEPDGDLFWGYLKITGPNVLAERPDGTLTLRKHDERFFYWGGNSKQKAKIPWQDVHGRRNAVERYNSVHSHQKDPANQQLPYVTYLQNERLTEGDLVWVEVVNGRTIRIHQIGSVSIPKLQYKHGISDLLPHHRPCGDYRALCPACRTFGWVRENAPENTQDPVAYAGRVRFSHGTLPDGDSPSELPETTLAILSTPKPTTTPFYLLDKDGQPDPTVTYDTEGARLRGRKFYRHQGEAKKSEYQRTEKSDQNRTVRGALKSGATFTFTVDFENLAPLELGALLYALELEEGMYHRLGYAKPLGFGSVKITVEEVKIIGWDERLRSLKPDAGRKPLSRDLLNKYKSDFLAAMHDLYGDEFDKVVLADLRALLSEPSDLPIHYPRTPKEPDPKGNNYEWFVGNKRLGKNGYPLPLPEEEKGGKGLPLLDKRGRRVT